MGSIDGIRQMGFDDSSIEISVTTLEKILDEINVKSIDLLTLDVEGYELEVLKGMQLFLSEHRIKNMLLEIDENKYQEVVSLLESYGYSIEKIMYNNYLVKLNGRGGEDD